MVSITSLIRVGAGSGVPGDSEGRELTFGERFSKDGFWVADYLQGSGYSKYLRGLAEMEEIDFDAGLNELRNQGFLDESDPNYPKIKWSE